MGDLISRETAVAILRAKADMSIGEVKDAASFFNHCANMIEKLPAVDAEPVRHGKWIEVPWIYYGAKQYMCDQCKGDEFWKKKEVHVMYPYCPNCGAKMDGGDA